MSDDLVGNANILKVELSPFEDGSINIYSHDGSIEKDIDFDDEIRARMQGERVKYFYYRKNGKDIELLNDAGELEW